jgi:ankyrin repeat protein
MMLPELLMAARSGDIKLLGDLLNGEDDAAAALAGPVVVDVLEGSLPIRRDPTLPALPAAVVAALSGVTSRGDSVLHVVAASGDGQEFLQCAELICNKASNLVRDSCNRNGDTPLHCAARASNVSMVSHLISLVRRDHGAVAAKALLRKQNKNGETVLHEAVRLATDGDLVKLLMSADPELARVPETGTSPLYLAISLGLDGTAQLLHDTDGGLSYSGPDGQSALHAAVLKGKGTRSLWICCKSNFSNIEYVYAYIY